MIDGLPLKEIDPKLLTDLSDIEIDDELSTSERIKQFLAQTKSPYLFRVNGRAVKVVFDNNADFGFEDGIKNALKSIFRSKS